MRSTGDGTLQILLVQKSFMHLFCWWPPRICDWEKAPICASIRDLCRFFFDGRGAGLRLLYRILARDGCRHKDEQGSHKCTSPDDDEPVLLKMLSRPELSSCGNVEGLPERRRRFQRDLDGLARGGGRNCAGGGVVPGWMDHLSAPFAGATNAIGANAGLSTSSACAI